MKVIIAGGRGVKVGISEIEEAVKNSGFEITELVSGGAHGVDESGEAWAFLKNIRITKFNALWNMYGKSAGPIRNLEMAEYADALIAFPGGMGTQNIINYMCKLQKPVHIVVL